MTKDELWAKAKKGNRSILSDPRVSTLRDGDGWTPLHELARRGAKEVLKHPDAGTLKNQDGNTPLHFLAYRGVKEVLDHPDAKKTKNSYGDAPFEIMTGIALASKIEKMKFGNIEFDDLPKYVEYFDLMEDAPNRTGNLERLQKEMRVKELYDTHFGLLVLLSVTDKHVLLNPQFDGEENKIYEFVGKIDVNSPWNSKIKEKNSYRMSKNGSKVTKTGHATFDPPSTLDELIREIGY